jgi:excisionase family DNA binding protein
MADPEDRQDPDDLPPHITVIDPEYWRTHPDALAEALADAEGKLELATSRPPVWSLIIKSVGSLVGTIMGATSTLMSGGAVQKPTQRRLTLTVEEAAQRLGVSRALAYEAVRRGEIPHIKIGRRILVPTAALEKLLDSVTPTDEDAGTG